jgi:hypothetical protein
MAGGLILRAIEGHRLFEIDPQLQLAGNPEPSFTPPGKTMA